MPRWISSDSFPLVRTLLAEWVRVWGQREGDARGADVFILLPNTDKDHSSKKEKRKSRWRSSNKSEMGLDSSCRHEGLVWGTRQYFQYFQGVWLLLDLMCARPVLCPLSHISGHRGVYGVCLLLLLGHT